MLVLMHHVSNEKSAKPLRETGSCWVIRKDRNGDLTWGQGEVSEELIQAQGTDQSSGSLEWQPGIVRGGKKETAAHLVYKVGPGFG